MYTIIGSPQRVLTDGIVLDGVYYDRSEVSTFIKFCKFWFWSAKVKNFFQFKKSKMARKLDVSDVEEKETKMRKLDHFFNIKK